MNKKINPIKVIDEVQQAFSRYYDDQFWINNPNLMKERAELLKNDGVMYSEPLLELIKPYPATEKAADIFQKLNLSPELGSRLAKIVFGGEFDFREHQAQSLLVSLANTSTTANHVIVNTGTGSGKTECFILPLLARFLIEEQTYGRRGQIHNWWESKYTRGSEWRSTRHRQDPANFGLRSLLLYPTNALVEDQITRLRRAALRSFDGREPLFYFGKYTGETPGGSWTPEFDPLLADKAREVSELSDEIIEQVELQNSLSDDEKIQFPVPQCGEMLTRWDMLSAAPDLLISNTSMLNVMLMRSNEDRLFDQTKIGYEKTRVISLHWLLMSFTPIGELLVLK